MKLYVWVDPYHVSYGSSLLIAIAESVDAAREQASAGYGRAYTYGRFQQDNVPNAKLGDPDRIVDLPCAEWHEWSE